MQINSLEKSLSSKKLNRKRKKFVKRYKKVFRELGVKPFQSRGE